MPSGQRRRPLPQPVGCCILGHTSVHRGGVVSPSCPSYITPALCSYPRCLAISHSAVNLHPSQSYKARHSIAPLGLDHPSGRLLSCSHTELINSHSLMHPHPSLPYQVQRQSKSRSTSAACTSNTSTTANCLSCTCEWQPSQWQCCRDCSRSCGRERGGEG